MRRLVLILLIAGCGAGEAPVTPPQVDPTPTGAVPAGFVAVPGGRFVMGSPLAEAFREEHEGPTHEVLISSPFLLGRTEVTVAEFDAFAQDSGYVTDAEQAGWGQGANGHERREGLSWRAPGYVQGPDHPVVGVSWNDAVAYANWRSRQDELAPCYTDAPFARACAGWRLPTEAEWEWAARAGEVGPWGGLDERGRGCEPTALATVGWMCATARGATHPVGALPANAFGLHDMLGNAWEWVHDGFDDYSDESVADPLGGAPGDDRANRGCGWGSRVEDCRVAMRVEDPPDVGFDNLGFRLARTLPIPRADHPWSLARARQLAERGQTEAATREAIRAIKLARVAEDMDATATGQRLLLELSGPGGGVDDLAQHMASQDRGQDLRLGDDSLAERVAADAAFFDARRYACPHEGLGLAFLTATTEDVQRWKGDVPEAAPGSVEVEAREELVTPASRMGWVEVCTTEGRASLGTGPVRLILAPAMGDRADGACLRGLGTTLDLTLEAATKETLAALGPQPTLRSLTLARTALTADALAALDAPNLTRLVVRETDVGDASLAALRAPSLEVLDLWNTDVSDAGVKELLPRVPGLTRLDLGSTDVTGAVLPAVARLASLRELELYELDVEGRLDALLGHGALAQLGLGGTDLAPVDLAVLAKLPALRALELAGSSVTDEDLAAVGACEGLEALGLGGTDVSGQGVASLAGLASLRRLHLGQTRVDDGALSTLGRLSSLEHLVLGETRVTDVGLAQLAGARRLRRLELWRTAVSAVGMRALRNVPLEYLSLGGTRVGGGAGLGIDGQVRLTTLELYDTAAASGDLAPLTELQGLRVLDLRATRIDDAALASLPETLEELELGATGVGDAGLRHLTRMTSLRRLGLRETRVTSAGLESLVGLPLRTLHLGLTEVDDVAAPHLVRLTTLADLDLRGTGVTDLDPLASLTGLRRLWLAGTEVRDLGPLAGLRDLEDLRAFGAPVDDAGAQALARLVGLRVLDLRDTSITSDGLAPMSALRSLRQLRLDGVPLVGADLSPLSALSGLLDLHLGATGVGAAELATLGCPPRLESISLWMTPVADDALPLLARGPSLGGIDLTGTAVLGSGLDALAALPRLDALELGATAVADDALVGLMGFSTLEELDLWFTDVTDAGLIHLAGLPIVELSIEGLPLTAAGVRALGDLPELKVLSLGATGLAQGTVEELIGEQVEVDWTGAEPPDRE